MLKSSKIIEDAIKVRILDAEDARDDGFDKNIISSTLIDIDEISLTLKVGFSRAKDISFDIRQPDLLEVTFVNPGVFIDAETGLSLAIESRNSTLIV